MRNYYEILEVSENASPEVIEKAYKTLAKKYHPDVVPSNKKQLAEENFKKIGEAYEVLSNVSKKAEYDLEFKNINNEIDNSNAGRVNSNASDYANTQQEAKQQSPDYAQKHYKVKHQPNNSYTQSSSNKKFEQALNEQERYRQEQLRYAAEKAYHDAYVKTLKDLGYTIKYKKTFKQMLRSLAMLILTFLVVCMVCFIAWQITPIREELVSFYEENMHHIYQNNNLLQTIFDTHFLNP